MTKALGVGIGVVVLSGIGASPTAASTPASAEMAHARKGKCDVAPWWHLQKSGLSIWLPAGISEVRSSCWLKQGSKSELAVWALQTSLKYCNGQSITVDGAFGPKTRQAVINVQARYGLSRDGVYGSRTRNAMKWRGSTGPYGSGKKVCTKYSSNGYWYGD